MYTLTNEMPAKSCETRKGGHGAPVHRWEAVQQAGLKGVERSVGTRIVGYVQFNHTMEFSARHAVSGGVFS